MKYLPLSYFDTYYALGNARNRLSDDIYLGSPSTMIQEDPKIEDEKRASFRLKRILETYKDLLGQPSSGSSSTSAFRLRKRGGTSSFRLKRIPNQELNKEYDVRERD